MRVAYDSQSVAFTANATSDEVYNLLVAKLSGTPYAWRIPQYRDGGWYANDGSYIGDSLVDPNGVSPSGDKVDRDGLPITPTVRFEPNLVTTFLFGYDAYGAIGTQNDPVAVAKNTYTAPAPTPTDSGGGEQWPIATLATGTGTGGTPITTVDPPSPAEQDAAASGRIPSPYIERYSGDPSATLTPAELATDPGVSVGISTTTAVIFALIAIGLWYAMRKGAF